MHLIYVDESGDDGLSSGASDYFVRCGLILHDRKWRRINNNVVNYRKSKKIPIDVEIHATDIKRGKSKKRSGGKRKLICNWWGKHFKKVNERINELERICNLINNSDITLIFVAIDKVKIDRNKIEKNTIKNRSWEYLIERINLFLISQEDKCGMIISDAIESNIESEHRNFVKALKRKSKHINPEQFIETILFEPSESSNLLQLADVASYSFFRHINYNDSTYFNHLKYRVFEFDDPRERNSGIKIWPE